jgi:hypothetical protein
MTFETDIDRANKRIQDLEAQVKKLVAVARAAEEQFDLDPGDTGYVDVKMKLWDALYTHLDFSIWCPWCVGPDDKPDDDPTVSHQICDKHKAELEEG